MFKERRADKGLVWRLRSRHIHTSGSRHALSVSNIALSTNNDTTEGFKPELLTIDASKSDVYALAVMLFQMLYGEYPWYQATTEDACYEFFLGAREEFFLWRDSYAHEAGEPGLSPEARTLLLDALEPDMHKRLDMYEFSRRFSLIEDFFGPARSIMSRTPSLEVELVSVFVVSAGSDSDEDLETPEQSPESPTRHNSAQKLAGSGDGLRRRLTIRNLID